MAKLRTMRNICYFVGTHGDWGGASRILFNVIRKLDRQQFNPIVMLTEGGPICEELDCRSIKYHIWGNHDYHNPISFLFDIAKCLFFFRRCRVDLIHLNHGCIGWRPAELIAAKALRIPVVMHCQRVVKKSTPNVRYATIVLTCSDYLAAVSNTASTPKKTIYDLVDLDRFGHGKNIRDDLRIAENDVIISFVGRTRKIKGVEMFIALSKCLPHKNVKFLMTGQKVGQSTPDSYSADEIACFVAQDERISYLGYREDIEDVYATSDIIVMPSQAPEPCAAVLIEAGACSKPIIATRTGSTPEFITHGENGYLVEREDLSAMAKYAETLISDEILRKTMGRRAREIVEHRFANKPILDIEGIYNQLIGAYTNLRAK